MKRLILAVLLLMPTVAHAERVTLTNPETLAVPTSSVLDWKVTLIDAKAKTLEVTYQWLDANQNVIRPTSGQTWRVWRCQDRPAQLVANCTAAGAPYACCTGAGMGTGCDPGSTCFADVFGFTIRSQDVGTKIGLGLRSLVWNKFKADLLSPANNGTFDAN